MASPPVGRERFVAGSLKSPSSVALAALVHVFVVAFAAALLLAAAAPPPLPCLPLSLARRALNPVKWHSMDNRHLLDDDELDDDELDEDNEDLLLLSQLNK